MDAEQMVQIFADIEQKWDYVLNQVTQQLNHAFILPIAREDALSLGSQLNHTANHIKEMLEKIVVYKLSIPKDAHALKMVKVLEEAVQIIKEIITQLPEVRKYHQPILDSCEAIKTYKHEGDLLYRAIIAKLFEDTEDTKDIIKWKEIYDNLENTLDCCNKISSIIRGVAVTYV